MKNIVLAVVLVFILLSGTTTIFTAWQDNQMNQYSLGPSGYLVVERTNDSEGKNLKPQGAFLGANDTDTIVYTYTVHVTPGQAYSPVLEAVTLHQGQNKVEDTYNLITIEVLDQTRVNGSAYDVLEVTIALTLEMPSTEASYKALSQTTNISFDLTFEPLN